MSLDDSDIEYLQGQIDSLDWVMNNLYVPKVGGGEERVTIPDLLRVLIKYLGLEFEFPTGGIVPRKKE